MTVTTSWMVRTIRLGRVATAAGAALIVLVAASPGAMPQRQSSVPFAGCMSDGQTGPIEAPRGSEHTALIDATTAKSLAYYKSEDGPGVLAPRGWHCFATYGSSGYFLLVTPEPIKSDDLLSGNPAGSIGPAVQAYEVFGDTSGRFFVARVIARVFPAERAFVDRVIREGIEPEQDFRFGPYATDKLTHKSDRIVEFQTPPQTEGLGTTDLGTTGWLKPNRQSIDGVAILQGGTPDLLLLTVRLAPDSKYLKSRVIQQFEYESRAQPPR